MNLEARFLTTLFHLMSLVCHIKSSMEEYPKKGVGKNDICTEYYYILEGSVEVWIDKIKFSALVGDIVVISPGCWSYLIAQSLKMLTITNPDWNAGQYKSK
jgi:hypothetical protein